MLLVSHKALLVPNWLGKDRIICITLFSSSTIHSSFSFIPKPMKLRTHVDLTFNLPVRYDDFLRKSKRAFPQFSIGSNQMNVCLHRIMDSSLQY